MTSAAAAQPRLGWWTKGLPPRAEGLGPDEIGRLGLDLLAGDLMMPAAVLRETALRNNAAQMQAFADRIGALLCPHGKTTMSPELFRMQLDAGAWGITAATAHHVRVYRRFGIRRIFLANQLVASADIDFILSELANDPEFDFYCLTDSIEGVDLLADAARDANCPRPVQLLVEAGVAGGRTGQRSVEGALALARHIAGAPALSLRGIELFEGISQAARDVRTDVQSMLDFAVEIARRCVSEQLFGDGPLIFSAGGSGFLDLCAAAMPATIGDVPVKRVIRPGCYISHDSGIYKRLTSREITGGADLPKLLHALEVWGVVQSVPEPGLAILSIGRRDASFDTDLPIPLWFAGRGTRELRALEGANTIRMWDQHLSLSFETGAIAVGDLLGFGISHPCSTFDRWTAILTVDDDYRVTGAITTCF